MPPKVGHQVGRGCPPREQRVINIPEGGSPTHPNLGKCLSQLMQSPFLRVDNPGYPVDNPGGLDLFFCS